MCSEYHGVQHEHCFRALAVSPHNDQYIKHLVHGEYEAQLIHRVIGLLKYVCLDQL